MAPGAQLPSHRELSEQLVIAPLTVKKAYDELEQLGLLEQQRGRGTFVRRGAVRGDAQAAAREGQTVALSEAVRVLLALAAAGISVQTGAGLAQEVPPDGTQPQPDATQAPPDPFRLSIVAFSGMNMAGYCRELGIPVSTEIGAGNVPYARVVDGG